MYALFRPSIEEDPRGIIDSIDFRYEVEMVPNWVEVVMFDIMLSTSAPKGEHNITIGLNAVMDDGSNLLVDTFDIIVRVVEEDEAAVGVLAVSIVVGILGVAVVVALLLRRKG
jgi:hypothetical protein